MPRIPNEYLGKKFAQLKETVKNKNKLLTTVMALIIFVVCTIEIISYKLPDIVTAKQYREFYFPFLCTLELFILSLFFVFKAFRYTACLDTKIEYFICDFDIYIVNRISFSVYSPKLSNFNSADNYSGCAFTNLN